MGKFDGVLLATDFDDTYFPESGLLPAANYEAVEYFKSQGGIFTVSTGRAHRTFFPFLHTAPVNAPVVLSNGAQLYDFSKNEMVVEKTLAPEAKADLEKLLERFPALGLEAYHGEEVYVVNSNPWVEYHLNKAKTDPVVCGSVSDIPGGWGKAILEQDNALLLPAQAYIREHWGDKYEAIFSNFHMLEITAKGATKGGMVLELAGRLGIDRAHIYCAGDNQNDIPMMEIAAEGFAPANCAQEVRDWGATILPDCESATIAALIDVLDKRY